jgi:hypothetical protein
MLASITMASLPIEIWANVISNILNDYTWPNLLTKSEINNKPDFIQDSDNLAKLEADIACVNKLQLVSTIFRSEYKRWARQNWKVKGYINIKFNPGIYVNYFIPLLNRTRIYWVDNNPCVTRYHRLQWEISDMVKIYYDVTIDYSRGGEKKSVVCECGIFQIGRRNDRNEWYIEHNNRRTALPHGVVHTRAADIFYALQIPAHCVFKHKKIKAFGYHRSCIDQPTY